MNKYLELIVERGKERIKYGNLRQRKIPIHTFKSKIIKAKEYSPVFFLSTGRTGTKFFTSLLQSDRNIYVQHASKNDLIEQGKVVYESYTSHDVNIDIANCLSAQIFLAARERVLYECYLHNKQFMETNNRITFFAHAIKKWMPGAKFVHLVRNPGAFIRSGVRREWYSGNTPHDIGRISPTSNSSYKNNWNEMDIIQKNAWLWNETNFFIEKFLITIPQQDYFQFNFDRLNEENVKNLMSFLNVNIDDNIIRRRIKKPVNSQKKGNFPVYEDWENEDKKKVVDICGELADKYGYDLS
ncbi:MAG: sulfotransferase [Cyclobacteriaceae bacterium]|nr:sulfotransferase [Cyclobacteriaceae bacterium]